VGVLLAALVLAGCGRASATTTPSPTPTSAPTQARSSTPNPLILAPATTPSTVGICSEQLEYGADGTAGPITCSTGAVNVLAWSYYVPINDGLFSAGTDASPSQIEALEASALKSSTEGWSIPIGDDFFCLASDYYGWNFGLDLAPAPAGTSYSC
jgi:hypothetical protein